MLKKLNLSNNGDCNKTFDVLILIEKASNNIFESARRTHLELYQGDRDDDPREEPLIRNESVETLHVFT